MTSFRDLLADRLGVGSRFCLVLEEEAGTLVAEHPNDHAEYDVAVVEGLDRLSERPPDGPVEIEILGRFVDDRLAGRVVALECESAENDGGGSDGVQ